MKPYLFFFAALTLAPAAQAQAPAVTEVFPPGANAGASQDATLVGANLAGATAILTSGKGVKVETRMGGDPAKLPVRITVDKGVQPGPRELRVVTANGVSNAALIWVGRYPDLIEKEPNDLKSPPHVVEKVPTTLNGQSNKAEDIDCFSFQAAAGETWVFALNAAGHRSRLDGYLQLRDERGRVLRSAMDGFERDPRLVHTFEKAGRYVIRVRDSMYRGGAGYTYRLSLGKLPVITRYSPMGGQRGTTINVRLAGVNLTGATAIPVTLPAGEQESVQITPATPLGPANPIELFISDAPEGAEHEPNDRKEIAGRIPAFPWAVSGRIGQSGDRDVYAFAAPEKQAVFLDVIARRVGSRLDGVIRILDATGKQLASNDDALGKDARLSFTAPAAGEYYAEVRSLSGRGGDDFYYRLELRPPPPQDFNLLVTPDNPAAPSGAAAVLTVTAQRRGYSGPIALKVEGLPEGLSAPDFTLAQGQNTAVIPLSAKAGVAVKPGEFRMIGRATIGGKEVQRVAEGAERYQPPLTNQPQQMKLRTTQMTVAAAAPAAPFGLPALAPAAVKAGQKLEIAVELTRTAAFKDAIAVTVLGLPPNVTVPALNLKASETKGKLTVTAAANAVPGEYKPILQGVGKGITVAAPLTLSIQPK